MLKRIYLNIKNSSKAHKIIDICLIVFLSLYIFSIPSFSDRKPLNLISYAFMILLALTTIAEYVFYKKFIFDRRLIFFGVFVIEALIGTLIHYPHDLRHWLTIVLVYLSFIIFYYAFDCIKNKKWILKIIAFAMLCFAIYFAVIYRNDITHLSITKENRLGGHFGNVNTVGAYFSLGAILFLYFGLNIQKKAELLYIIPSAILLYLGLFTGSRQFLLTTFIALYFVVVLSIKKRKWIAIVVLVLAIVAFIILLNLPQLKDLKDQVDLAIDTMLNKSPKPDPSVIQRVLWPSYGFHLGSKELLFGYGVEGFSYYSGIFTYSHNNYSEVLCNFGIIGLVIFYSSLLFPLVLAVKSKDRSLNIVLLILIFYLSKGLFSVYYYTKDAYLMFAVCFYFTKQYSFGKFGIKETKKEEQTMSFDEVSI